jgi:ABC-type nickel/cobalt efflux system permease component RcnA
MKNIKYFTLALIGVFSLTTMYTHTSVKDLAKHHKIKKILEEIEKIPKDQRKEKALELIKKYSLPNPSDKLTWLGLPPPHTHTHARTHARAHAHTHTLNFSSCIYKNTQSRLPQVCESVLGAKSSHDMYCGAPT